MSSLRLLEVCYLNELRSIIDNGYRNCENRTKVDTITKYDVRLYYDLSDDVVPILTTRRMNWKGIITELLWIIDGSTDAKILIERGLRIWEKNTSRSYLDSVNLKEYEEGDTGPYVPFQFRHWGAPYLGNKSKGGIDQLKILIEDIKKDPTSRRLVLNSWNVADLKKMCLPPCVMMLQFHVRENTYLDCTLTQRSGDMALGVPWNSACYAILTIMLAHVTNLKAGTLCQNIGNAHLYNCHENAMKELLERKPRNSPILKFLRKVTDIGDFKLEDFAMENYTYEPAMRLEMVV